jgi:hypothetical protein
VFGIGDVSTSIGESEADSRNESVEPESRVVLDLGEVDFALFLNRFENAES